MSQANSFDSIRVFPSEPGLFGEPPLTTLQRAVLRAGVSILDETDVQAHQAEKLEEAKRQAMRPRWSNIPAGVVALAVSVACLVQGFLVQSTDDWFKDLLGFWLCALGVFSAVVFVAIARGAMPSARRRLLEWRSYDWGFVYGSKGEPLSSYCVPGQSADTVLPDEGLAICEAFRKTGELVRFSVEQLDDDPFLAVVDGSEKFYLFAWDEKGFLPR